MFFESGEKASFPVSETVGLKSESVSEFGDGRKPFKERLFHMVRQGELRTAVTGRERRSANDCASALANESAKVGECCAKGDHVINDYNAFALPYCTVKDGLAEHTGWCICSGMGNNIFLDDGAVDSNAYFATEQDRIAIGRAFFLSRSN